MTRKRTAALSAFLLIASHTHVCWRASPLVCPNLFASLQFYCKTRRADVTILLLQCGSGQGAKGMRHSCTQTYTTSCQQLSLLSLYCKSAYLSTVCLQSVCCLSTVYLLFVYCLSTVILYVYCLFTVRLLSVYCLSPVCLLSCLFACHLLFFSALISVIACLVQDFCRYVAVCIPSVVLFDAQMNRSERKPLLQLPFHVSVRSIA